MDRILDSAPCGFVSFFDDGTILLANATLAAMVGRDPASLVGSALEKLFTVGARIFYQTHFFPLLKVLGTAEEIYLTLRAADGGEIPVLVNGGRRERDGRVVYDFALFAIRQRGQFEDEILRAKRAAEDAGRARDEFLAVVAHELRTPLNAILGWAHLMKLDRDDPETAEHGLETIVRNGKALARLIDDLLDVSRIVSGRLRLDVEPVDPRPVVEAALDVVRPAAQAKAIRVEAALDPDAGSVSADPDRLQQVFWNLLSNAVKFTPRGGTVRVRLRRDGSHVEILVADSGRGISPEFLPYVFDRFRQAEGASTSRQAGLGLGMAITREIVELHGGTIVARSEGEGRGATFTVTLPALGLAGTTTSLRDSRAGEIPGLDGLHVLLVDDAPDARDFLAAILIRGGAVVTASATAGEAFDRLRELRPAVIVSDVEMPEESGHSLIRRVRNLPAEQGGATPAIALTARNRFADRMRALSAGFQVHLTKPVEPDELIAVIANLCRPADRREVVGPPEHASSGEPGP